MHVRWNYPPCIQRCNKECLPFNTTLVLRGFIPRFSVTRGRCPAFVLFSQVPWLMVQLVSKTAVKPRFEDVTLVAQRQVS